ncbi:PPOX class probable F420-dependent enzyme [Amycolatopsis xylanica]|uniref:PPOX class probable F420-dependent enzyme n=1 Tax=Amycolatopsis xylanica TaxID=589385 RepID=A0A1H3JBN3_9PSEU|nr:PPOX class F420-dependent oxidoreductase [Amycolatopsis xylanica]SDY37430.1 PPOX class probable F420-dependent enzyme [Amycolatopsis xylanica]
MREMSRDEWWKFASEGTRTGKLAIVRADGRPHVTPIWFLLNETPDGDELVFTTGKESLKGKVLRRDPRLSLCVDDQKPPFSYIQFSAIATLHEDLAEMYRWARDIGGRYMGTGRAEEYGKRNAVPEEYLVRAKITKVIASAGIAD